MTPNEAREIIHQAFVDNWDPDAPEVPYIFDNEKFDSDELPEWVKVYVRNSPGGQITLGGKTNRVYRRRGAVLVEIHSPVDQGLLRLDELAKAALDIYEGENHSQVMFNNGSVTELPVEGRWARNRVSVFFTYDETK